MRKTSKSQPLRETVNDIIIEETALDVGVSKALAYEVVSCQDDFIAYKIREGGFEGILIPRLGKIKIKPTRVHAVQEAIATADIKKNTEIR